MWIGLLCVIPGGRKRVRPGFSQNKRLAMIAILTKSSNQDAVEALLMKHGSTAGFGRGFISGCIPVFFITFPHLFANAARNMLLRFGDHLGLSLGGFSQRDGDDDRGQGSPFLYNLREFASLRASSWGEARVSK